MKSTRYYILTLTILAALTGCKDYDELMQLANPVSAELAFTVSQNTGDRTRMAAEVVQTNDGSFRGLQMLRAIPFAITGEKVTGDDRQKVFEPDGATSSKYDNKTIDGAIKANFYYIEHCSFMSGTNAFLTYAQASPASTEPDVNGALVADIPVDRNRPVSDIEFRLQSIRTDNSAPDAATAIAGFLTEVANTHAEGSTVTWATVSSDVSSNLYNYFQDFIARTNNGPQPLPGSAASVKADLAALHSKLAALNLTGTTAEAKLCQAIMAKIAPATDGFPTTFPTANDAKDYPASIGLPDGAAVVRWHDDVHRFAPETETNTMASITSISRYAYPAELWYYSNSRINTSTADDRKTYYTSKEKWADVLSQYEYTDGIVSPDTKAVAIKDPLQYAVAHLEIKLAKLTPDDSEATPLTATLKDSKGNDVTVGNETFCLTGIIVGRQFPQDFKFTPKEPVSDLYECFAYDHHVKDGTNDIYLCPGTGNTVSINTLLLQTPSDTEHKEIPITLEFTNKGDDFYGFNDGIVYKGTKFYLVGKIRPSEGTGPDEAKGQVLTRDYTTTLTMKVASLKDAYNVLPDLMSARLELGVQVEAWEQATPTEVTFD